MIQLPQKPQLTFWYNSVQTFPLAVKQAANTISYRCPGHYGSPHRWRDRKVMAITKYAVTVTESATCKNGKSFANMHRNLHRRRQLLPEQIEAEIKEKLVFEWEISALRSAKVKGRLRSICPTSPSLPKKKPRSGCKPRKGVRFTAREL